jgi:hypothetical protein
MSKRVVVVGVAPVAGIALLCRGAGGLRRYGVRQDDRAYARRRTAEVDLSQHERDPREHGSDPELLEVERDARASMG